MSDNIDYDELDKAVNKAIKANTKKTTAQTPVAQTSNAQKTVTPKPRARQYMDFVRRTPIATAPKTTSGPVAIPKPQPTIATKPVAKKAVARKATTPVVTPKPAKLIPNAATKPVAPVVRKTAAKTASNSMPQYRTAAANARVAAKAAAAPAAEAKPEPKPAAKPAPKPEPAKSTISNANNFSLGGKSPFLTGAQVEKTPLGKNPQQNSANSIESTKNTYSQKSPLAAKISKKHTITEDPKNGGGWMRVLGVILMIAAGLGLGLLAWLIISPNLGK